MAARIYNADHAADIRSRLEQMALVSLGGLFLAAAAAAVVALVDRVGNGQWSVLVRLAWITVIVLVSICLVSLALIAVLWILYRRRRAELDAQGAEIDGELRVRIANLRRDPEP